MSTIEEAVLAKFSDHMEYLKEKGGEPANLHRLIIEGAEKPLFEAIMGWAGGNQSLAAEALGINRATLRTRLKRYNLI